MRTHIHLIEPHPLQEEIIFDEHKFIVVNCGRRWGKSELAKLKLSREIIKGNIYCSYTCYDYKSMLEIFEYFSKTFEPLILNNNKSTWQIVFKNGSKLSFFSCHGKVDIARGFSFDYIVVDEGAIIKNLETIFFDSLLPTLADRNGSAMILSTPKGFDDFYDLYNMQDDSDDWISYHAPTSSNPHISEEVIANFKAIMSEDQFGQEFEANFCANNKNQFIKNELITNALIGIDKDDIPSSDKISCGFDVCDGGDDYFAVAIWNGNLLVHAERWKSETAGVATRKAIKIAYEYKADIFAYDCIGVGSSVKSELFSLKNDSDLLLKTIGVTSLTIKIKPFRAGTVWTSDDYYMGQIEIEQRTMISANQDANWLFFKLMLEYGYITINKNIPDLTVLMKEISGIEYETSPKIKIFKKGSGSKSPDIADAAMIGIWGLYGEWKIESQLSKVWIHNKGK